MRALLRFLSLALLTLLPIAAHATPLGKRDIQQAVSDYAAARGFRVGCIEAKMLRASKSGKSTLALITIGGRRVRVAVNDATGRVQAQDTEKLIEGLLAAHQPYARAGLGKRSRFATELVAYRPGEGAEEITPQQKAAPLGRPRAGQSLAQEALDALPLGPGGSAVVRLPVGVVVGKRGAAIRVRENTLGPNQTPGLVRLHIGSQSYRLGYAGYDPAGDVLLLSKAIDPLPLGAVVTDVSVTDDPSAPHPLGLDATDNATASARGVRGFDLVSVEGMPGSGK